MSESSPEAKPLADAHPEPPLLPRRTLLLGAGLATLGGWLAWRSLRRVPAAPSAPDAVAPARVGAATVLNDTQELPDFRLQSPTGPLDRQWLRGHWSLVFFGYTQCPDVCPGTLGMLAEALRGLPAGQRPQVLFISVDPDRDTPELLAQYVPSFDPAFRGAAGQDEDLAALVRHLGVHYERHSPGAAGQYTVDHTASVFLIDPGVRLKALFSPPHDAAGVAASLGRLIG